MNIFDSYIDAGQDLSIKERKEYYCALVEYLAYGEQPQNLKGATAAIWTAIFPSLELSRKRSKNGAAGGRRKQANREYEAEQNANLLASKTQSKTQANDQANDQANPQANSEANGVAKSKSNSIKEKKEKKESASQRLANTCPFCGSHSVFKNTQTGKLVCSECWQNIEDAHTHRSPRSGTDSLNSLVASMVGNMDVVSA